MSDTTIPRPGRRHADLPPANQITGAELIAISQNGKTCRVTVSELMALAIAQHQAALAPHPQYEVGDVEAAYIAAQQPNSGA